MNPLTEAEKHQLLSAWLGGSLDEKRAGRLLAAAKADPGLRQEMAALLVVDRLVRHHSMTQESREVFSAELAARLQAEVRAMEPEDRQFVQRIEDRVRLTWVCRWRQFCGRVGQWLAFPRAGFGVPAAALVLLLVMVLGRLLPGGEVATVEALEGVRWARGQRVLVVQEVLSRGRIEFGRGFIKLRFPKNTTVIVEGPAVFELVAANRIHLELGKIVADVGDPKSGFTIESPDGRVVDLGTRFGVSVGASGTEVQVLKGLVKTKANGDSDFHELRQAQGVLLNASGVTPIEADTTRFLTALPPRTSEQVGYVHWAFDEGEGDTAINTGHGLPGAEVPARLTSLLEGHPGPEWVPGRFGNALEFDGKGDYVATDFGGIGGGQPRTVAFWARVPQDWKPINGFALVSWGTHAQDKPGLAWQISINPIKEDGPLGRLRVGVLGGQVVGTHDMRDGQWHHIAVVLYGVERPDTGTHVLLYVDGELEHAERKKVHEIQTDVQTTKALPVRFGRNLASDNSRRVFRGTIDEVYIFDAALTQDDIKRLALENVAP